MAELNNTVENLVAYWGEINVDIKDLETRLGKEVYGQLDSYILEIESNNEEIDVDRLIGDLEDAQYMVEEMQGQVDNAVDSIANAIANAEDLR
jgi:ABC-type phosphate transport system auxiliary subunit